MKRWSNIGALLSAAAFCSTPAAAGPVTFLFDSGAFSYSQTPLFGTHFTAALTFSDDLIPNTLGFDYLNQVSQVGSPPSATVHYQHATLLNWSVTSGSFMLDASNATIASNVYTYTSASTGYVPQFFLSFAAVGNNIVPGGTLPVRVTAESGLNITDGIGINRQFGSSIRDFNHGGGTISRAYNYTGAGGLGGSGSGSGSGSGGGAGAVPEPATWAMMILGMGAVGFAMRRRARASVINVDARIKRIAEGAAA